MSDQPKVAYYVRKSIQHLPPVIRLLEELPGAILTNDREVFEHVSKKYPEHASKLVFFKRSRNTRSWIRKNRVRIVIYPAFKSLSRVMGVQIFHGGMSDKRYLETSLISLYDLVLFPGQKSRDKVERVDLLKWIHYWKIIGYPKFDPLVNQTLSYEPVFNNGDPTVLYAPTWISETRKGAEAGEHRHSEHGESSIPLWGTKIIEQLPAGVNLIIKFHSQIHPEGRPYHDQIEALVTSSGKSERVRVLYDDNILQYMDEARVMISDISSACYEWFHFDRPILFANPAPEHYRPSSNIASSTYAWQAGDVINEEADIKTLIERNIAEDLHKEKRREIFEYTVFSPDGNATHRQADAIRELNRQYEKLPYWCFYWLWRFKHLRRKLIVRFILGRGLRLE